MVGPNHAQPLWKMMDLVSWDDDIPNIFWKNLKKSSKPPTSDYKFQWRLYLEYHLQMVKFNHKGGHFWGDRSGQAISILLIHFVGW